MSEIKATQPSSTGINIPFRALKDFPDIEKTDTGLLDDDKKPIVEVKIKSQYVAGQVYHWRGNPQMLAKIHTWITQGKVMAMDVLPESVAAKEEVQA